MSNYDYWHDAMKGKFGPVHDSDPQCGFFRARNKGRPDDPVAIWIDTSGGMLAFRRGAPVDPYEIWSWVCRAPIAEEVYRGVMAGGSWPDAIEELIGSNNPPEGEAQADEIQSAIDAALAELQKPLVAQLDCDRLANHKDRLAKLYTAQEKERESKKRPHLEAGRAVDAAYKPILNKIEEAGNKLKKAITAFLLKEEQRRRAEAIALMQKQEEERRAALAANVPPPAAEPVPEVERPKAGTTGRAISLRTYKSAMIKDYAAALQHFADNPEVKALIQTLADREARADVAAPGCEIHTEQRAA
jgi:hypothetical protein